MPRLLIRPVAQPPAPQALKVVEAEVTHSTLGAANQSYPSRSWMSAELKFETYYISTTPDIQGGLCTFACCML